MNGWEVSNVMETLLNYLITKQPLQLPLKYSWSLPRTQLSKYGYWAAFYRGVSKRTTATRYRTDPVSSTEVHSFSKVVALVKSRVIGTRKCHNKLSSTLIGPVHLNTKWEQRYKTKNKTKRGRQMWSVR